MASVGTTLAIPSLVDLTIGCVHSIISKIQTYHHTKELYKDHLEIHDIQAGQLVICLQFVRDATPSLTQDLNAHLLKTLSRLNRSLEATHATLDRGIDKEGNVRRLWYVTLGGSALKRDLDEVEKDQVLFQRAVQLAALYGGPRVAPYLTEDRLRGNSALARVQRLREAIQSRLNNDTKAPEMLLDRRDIPDGKRKRLPYSEAQLVMSGVSEFPTALIESRSQNTPDMKKIRDIALILGGTDVSMAMIRCRGFIPVPDTNRYELLFPLPQNPVRPRTLRELLLSPDNNAGVRFSLNSRVKLAQRLATAVLFIHTAKLVHKNIRPENIIILETASASAPDGSDGERALDIGDSFLMGFDFARKEDETSTRVGDNEWYRNIYRHPQRQGVHPEVDFNMLHDIYSLGVVLLEIALWRSFVLIEKDVYGGLKYAGNREACRFFDRNTGKLKNPYEIWELFIRRSETVVAPALGYKYRDTILMCLRCLDGGFGDPAELADQDGVLMGLAYIERVLMTLDEIAV
ncbi:hypothetical protein GP486_001101 [Trichoglossum hirsutum]|uniref:Protein kinase domain-containing protein n=1 Tax=Trichoglossum hirsutum TaxID=265104 RepID=A0A9P8LHB4_9PEZI|nr:hypothetical protein GP486_001101 [Trichoglossum hirsutum]